MQGQRVLELLGQILIDGFAALQNGSSVLKAFDLFKDEAGGVDFVLACPVDGDDALAGVPLGLPVRQYLDLGSARPLRDVSDHVAFCVRELLLWPMSLVT